MNVGIVLGASWRAGACASDGAERAVAEVVGRDPAADDDAGGLADGGPVATDRGRRARSATACAPGRPGWLLVGDAAGFLDPFTGEGLHRALVSAELAAAVDRRRSRPGRATGAAERYERAMRRRFLGQGRGVSGSSRRSSAGRPCSSTPRAGSRPGSGVRATMGLVMGDLVAADRALDPRFLAALLAP